MTYRTAILIACVILTISGCGRLPQALKTISGGTAKVAPRVAPQLILHPPPKFTPILTARPAREGGRFREFRNEAVQQGIQYGFEQFRDNDKKNR